MPDFSQHSKDVQTKLDTLSLEAEHLSGCAETDFQRHLVFFWSLVLMMKLLPNNQNGV